MNLLFFDKNGDSLNLIDRGDGVMEGSLFFGLVSSNLISSNFIFVIEKLWDGSDFVFGKPLSLSLASLDELIFNIKDGSEFFFYDDSGNAIFTTYNQVSTFDNTNTYLSIISLPTGYFKQVLSYSSEAIRLPIGFLPKEDGGFDELLEIHLNGNLYASIRLYGECESSDDRLPSLLSNMGVAFDRKDLDAMKGLSVYEAYPDWVVVNRKMKEALLEMPRIKRHIGSYISLFSALDFYGYPEIKVKEAFENIKEGNANFGNMKLIEVSRETGVSLLGNLDNRVWRKSRLVSLAWRLNKVTNVEDDFDDLPLTEEDLGISLDEAILKLSALREVIQRKYTPLTSNVFDIIGEGDYFSKLPLRHSRHSLNSFTLDVGAEPEFEISYVTPYIEDIRSIILEMATNASRSESLSSNLSLALQDFNIDPSQYSQLPSLIQTGDIDLVDGYKEVFLRYFLETGKAFSFSRLADSEGCPVANIIKLDAVSFVIAFDEADTTFDSLENVANNTFDTFGFFDNYECSWEVLLEEGQEGKSFYYRKDGLSKDNYSLFVALPYIGTYLITLSVSDGFGYTSKRHKRHVVEPKNVQFYGMCRKWEYAETFDQTGDVSIDSLNFSFDRPFLQNIPIDSLPVTFEALNSANYTREPFVNMDVYNFDAFEANARMDTLGHLTFNEMDIFKNTHDLSINSIGDVQINDYNERMGGGRVSSDIPPHFILYNVQPGSSIRIGSTRAKTATYPIVRRLDGNGNPALHIEGNLVSVGPLLTINRDAQGYILDVNGILAVRDPNIYVFEVGLDGIATGNIIPVPSPHGRLLNRRQLLLEIAKYSEYISTKTDTAEFYSVVGHTHTFTGDLQTAADELNAVTTGHFSRYRWNAIKDEFDVVQKIFGISKYDSDYGNGFAEYFGDIVGTKEARSVNQNMDFENLYASEYKIRMPNYTLATFSYDNCKIAGKCKPKWKITHYSSGESFSLDQKWFSHFFKKEGEWNLSLELHDSNGNVYFGERKAFLEISSNK